MDTTQPNAPRRSLRVLLVEDSPLLTARLGEVIGRLRDVELIGVVDSQADAVTAVRRDRPDVMVLDLHLRYGTGFGVLRAIRFDEYRPKTVVLTTYDLAEYRREAQTLGAMAFLEKSRDYDKLPQLLLELQAKNNHD